MTFYRKPSAGWRTYSGPRIPQQESRSVRRRPSTPKEHEAWHRERGEEFPLSFQRVSDPGTPNGRPTHDPVI